LNSFLSKAGIASRRKCSELIKQGTISVNGKLVFEPGFSVNPDIDRVCYNSRTVKLGKKFTYILLNKPKGFVCTLQDERHRSKVTDLIETDSRVFPVGRLDISTTGLLLITDDGELNYRLTHPKFHIDKVYIGELHKPLQPKDRELFQKGVFIGKNDKVSGKCRILDKKGQKIEITIHEGKNRMLKRMFYTLGYTVKSLDRIKFAGLTKKKLPRGGWRFLSIGEIRKLYKIVNLSD